MAAELSNRHRVFIDEYFLHNMNGTDAYMAVYPKASYDTARANAAKLLATTSIKAEIERRLKEKQLSADEVLTRLAEQARADMADFLEFKDGVKWPYLDLKGAQEKGLLRLVKKFKYNNEGRPEIELYDAQAAMVHLGKHHGLFVDERRVTVTVEKELNKALDKLEQRLDADTYAAVLAALADGEAGEAETGAGGASDPEIE